MRFAHAVSLNPALGLSSQGGGELEIRCVKGWCDAQGWDGAGAAAGIG